jgi:outer membrane protein TolC
MQYFPFQLHFNYNMDRIVKNLKYHKRLYRIVLALLFICCASYSLSAQTAGPDGDGAWDRERLLAAALRGNNAYLLTSSRSREAGAVLSTTRAAAFPVLKFSSNLSYLTNPPGVKIDAGSLYPGGNIPMPSPLPPIPFPALPEQDLTMKLSENTRYEFGLTLEQPIFTWGRIRNSIQAANLGSRASALQLEQDRRNIGTALDIHLATLAVLSEIRDLLAEQRNSADRLIRISEESFANGFILQADLLEARLLAAEVRLGDYSIQESWNNSFLAIKTLTGLTDLEAARIRLPSREALNREYRSYAPSDQEQLSAQFKTGNLSLKLLSFQTQAAERLLAASQSQLYAKPDLGLFLQIMYGGPRFPFAEPEWRDDDSFNFTATLGIRSVIFDWSLYGTASQKKEKLAQARLEEEKGRLDLEEYLEKTLRQLELSRYRQEYLALKIEAAETKKEQDRTAWEGGYGEEREYLARELAWRQDRISLLQEELAALITVLQMENMLGGGL